MSRTYHRKPFDRRFAFNHGRALAYSCGKIRFEGRGAAKQAASKLKSRGLNQKPYACRHCGGWHLYTADKKL